MLVFQCGAWQQPGEAKRTVVHVLNCTLRRDFLQWPWQELLEIIGNCRRCRSCRLLSRSTMREGIHDDALPVMLEGGAVREELVSRNDSN